MRFKSILVFSLLFSPCFLPLSAQSQERELSPGLNYTTIYNKPKPVEAETPDVPQAQAPVKPIAPQVTMAKPAAQAAPEEDAQARVWNKYKALATGKAGQEQAEQKAAAALQVENAPEAKPAIAENQGVKTKTFKPQLMHASETAQAPAPSAPASGITAILQEWKTSKTQQSEMRSKSFKVPALPEGYRTQSESAIDAVTKAVSETSPAAAP